MTRKMKRLFVMAAVTLMALTSVVPVNAASEAIGKSKAMSIVRNHTTALKNKTLTVEVETDDGVRYYVVRGKTSSRAYKYEIDAYSGQILSRKWKSRKLTKGSKNLTKTQARKVIDEEVTARKNQKNFEIEKEREDGVLIYEIDFNTSKYDYDVEVNGTTGKLYELEWDLRNKKPNIPSTTQITRTKAISYAKKEFRIRLGLTSAQAQNIEIIGAELDRDDGRYVYDVELRYGRYECEAEVDANTGKILDIDIDD